MTGFGHDITFAFRLIRKRPFAAFVIVATLGLGIGVNAAFFAAFYGMSMRPLPFESPDELVQIYRQRAETNETYRPVSDADLFFFRESETLASLGAYDPKIFNLRSEGPPERVEGSTVTANLFSLLGVAPEQGRLFKPEEGLPGGARVVLIGHALWQRSFAGDPEIIGKEIRLDGEPAEVIGIMPPGFGFPLYHELWAPLQIDRASAEVDSLGLAFIGRLATGHSHETAELSLDVLMADLRQRFPEHYRDETAKVRTLHDSWMPPVTQVAAMIMQALASLVLLIVCANVANMVLAQATLRRQEKALRVALGASRLRLVRQATIESTILAALGGVIGILLALWHGEWLNSISAVPIPYWLSLKVDLPVLIFAVTLTLVTGVGVGLVPGLRSVGGRLMEGLKSGGRSDGANMASEGRLRAGLVVAEYALAVVILAGALMMVQAYERLQHAETGFAVDERLTLKLALPFEAEEESAESEQDRRRGLAIVERSLTALRQMPEVKTASATSFLPIENGPYFSSALEVEGFVFEENREPRVTIQAVAPDYFQTLDVKVLAGRPFTAGEYADGGTKALISSSLAERLWPGESALGRRLRPDIDEVPMLDIVGVTADVEPGEPLAGIDRRPGDQIYVPMALSGYGATGFLSRTPVLLIETEATLAALAPKLRDVLAVAEPEVPVYGMRSMELVLRQHYFAQHVWSRMFALIAFVALGIAALGAYGVSAYAVSRRVHEIGIRLALGAHPRRLMVSVIGGGVKQAALGLAIGLALAVPMAGAMTGLLHGVSLWSSGILMSVIASLVFVSFMATLFPARRAATVDPIVALRDD